MSASLTILILGGYGTFGGRLAQLLADEERLHLIIAGRSEAAARAFCAGLASKARLSPRRFDRAGDVEAELAAIKPDIVVDASGPFQAYGQDPHGDPYRLVRAAIALGIDYLDLADGSGFVAGIGAFDEAARSRGVFVLTGVSSFPVLTVAVLRRLSQGLTRLDSVAGGIAPSPYAGVGLNVIRAVASYAGQRVRLRRDGAEMCGYPLTETRRFTVAPPGLLPLRSTLFSLVDVPDLQVVPALWPQLRSVWIGVGPVPETLHRVLIQLARLVRLGILPTLSPLAPLMARAVNILRFGEHRGGMFVSLAGLDREGKPIERSWHLLAEGDDGPLIPSMAAEAVIRHCLAGHRPEIGARAATHELELADYEALFARRRLFTGLRDSRAGDADLPLYRRLLGDSFASLPAPLQALHDPDPISRIALTGEAEVERGSSLLSRLVGAVFGFPRAGRGVSVTVRIERHGPVEQWRRNFAGKSFASRQSAGSGRTDKLLRESFGPFGFDLALVVDGGRLRLIPRGWSLLGMPLPSGLAPRGEAYEFAEGRKFHFHVEIVLPLIGLVVRYRGWLERVVSSEE
ncbi:Saccharopine dehydrogenase NADP binding domain-containing protein [Rhizobiales bacterium GAS188]|nr:Saccharopine dehydrogenase NADP binding domain-containing protein [Rhizobiales bacterium GAS188]